MPPNQHQGHTENTPTGRDGIPAASIRVTPVSFDDQGAKYIVDPDEEGVYTHYMVTNRFEHDPSIYMIPAARPPQQSELRSVPGLPTPSPNTAALQAALASVAFVQLAAPTLLWISEWTCCRFKKHPKIPDPTFSDPNWIYLGMIGEPVMITAAAADGATPLYRISGTYVYGHRNPDADPAKAWADMGFPTDPRFENVFDRVVKDADLQQGIIDLGQRRALGPQPGFPGQGGN